MKNLFKYLFKKLFPTPRFIGLKLDRKINHPKRDDISLAVQECGGYFEIGKTTINFYVPEKKCDFILLKYPFLTGSK